MTSKAIYPFPDSDLAILSEVGGKGLSLIIASQEGLSVPPGFILSVTFFRPWFAELKATKEWTTFLKAETKTLEKACSALKKSALQFVFTKEQEQEIVKNIEKYGQDTLFAVRSSSPEEDLEGSSFAGGYETVLGVAGK